jgi:hypothetical protein
MSWDLETTVAQMDNTFYFIFLRNPSFIVVLKNLAWEFTF